MSERRHDVWTWMRDHNIPVGGVASGIDKLIEHCIRLGQREAFAAGFERGVAHERGKYADEYEAWLRWSGEP